MESACSKRFLCASPGETECYLYAKRNKTENDQKIREKDEQQKLEQIKCCGSKYQISAHELYLLERKNNRALEKQSCDTARRTCMREFCSSKTCSNEGLACRVSENEPFTIKWSTEDEDQSPTEDDISLKVHGQPLETELLNVSSTAGTCQKLPALNPPQMQQNHSIEQNNKRNKDNELKQSSSVASLNNHMFQTELLRQKSVSSKKWQRYQLFQIPFVSGTSSVFSCIESKKSKFLKNVCSAEDKNYSTCNEETTAEKDIKEKDNSLYIIQTLRPFKSIQPLEIPNFLFPKISNKIKSKQSSTNFRETDWKNFEGEPSLMQSEQIDGVQKMSEIGKQKMHNDESNVRASAVDSEFKEKNCPPINKQEQNALAEGEVSGTYSRCNSTDSECNKIFAENDVKDKLMENSEGDDDQKSKTHIYISAENVQNDKRVSSNDLLQRRGRKSTNENVGTLHMQMSFPVTTEVLEKKKLNLCCSVHDSNRDIHLYETESKLSTKEMLDFQSYVTKNITFKSNCPCIFVQDFPDKRASCNVFRGKEMLKLKFSFQNTLFGWVRMWTESFHEDMPRCQDDSVTPWSHCRDTLKEQCDAQELVKSTINRNHNDKIFMCLLAVVSKHLKVEVLKIMLASFFSSTNALLTTEGMSVRGEKQSLCNRKQNQLNSCTDDSLRQTTGFLRENENFPGFVSSKFVENIDFELHNVCQRRCFSRTLGKAEYTFLLRSLFHNQKSRLCKGRHVRKHHLLSRVSEGFSTDLRSVNHKNSMKKQILPVKYLFLLQGFSDSSSLRKIYCCNITKVHYLIGGNLGYFPAHSQPKFDKVHKKSTSREISLNILKQEKNEASIRFNSSFHVDLFKAHPFVLYENKKHKTTGYRNCITSTNEVTNEVTYTMKKCLGNSSYVSADEKEYINSKELQMNCHDFLSKNSFSIFDTYEKIPLATDSEDFDQIPVVKQDSYIKKKLCEQSAVTGPKEIQCLPGKTNDVLILSEQPKASTEEYNSLLLLDRHINKHDNYKVLDICSPHPANKKVDDQNTYLFSENLFPSSSNTYQSVTLPLDSNSFVNSEMSKDGHCRNSSSADKQKASETIPAMVQYLSKGSPAITDTYLQLQAKETAQFSLQGHEQMKKTGSSEPATLKQRLEYVKEQEERNYEQMHVTNESQCETVMNYLIISYSEDKSKTFIAAEEELKMPLSIMNNGCLEDVKDKYLPLENKNTHEFELKGKFDLVLEELRMFHEISKEDVNNLSSLETNLPNSYWELNNAEGIDENIARVSQRNICTSSPICGTTTGKHITDINESSLHKKISYENEEQKVSKEYSISRMSSKELQHSPAEGAAYRKPYTWGPAFLPNTVFNEQSYNLEKEGGYFLSRDVVRVQPLKTCKGPIRIGLSRKARPKKLHPYLK